MTCLLKLKHHLMRTLHNSSTYNLIRHNSMTPLMTSQEVATALRPFIFVVHPDRFWQFPNEKETNENSLKLLNAHIESLIEMKQTKSTRVTFFMHCNESDNRNKLNAARNDTINQNNVDLSINNKNMRQIHIDLSQLENINSAVHRILSQSKLSTEYLSRIGKQPKPYTNTSDVSNNYNNGNNLSKKFTGYRGNMDVFWMRSDQKIDMNLNKAEEMIKRITEPNLIEWLRKNNDRSQDLLRACLPIREELRRLSEELRNELNLKELIWDCGWGASHIRGCLKSLYTLKQQHSNDLNILRGKTVEFGTQSGVSFDGHVILNIEDVRHNWLETIKKVPNYDPQLKKIPFAERVLSGTLRGIEIDHRKYRPAVIVNKYIQLLEKLTSALVEFTAQHHYPKQWPNNLSNYQLVVECESGPLMLSPTGQFIVPASCPAFLLVDFISENLQKAAFLREAYSRNKYEEIIAINKCLTALALESIDKDDNVTPDLMISCCLKLVSNKDITSRLLRNSRLRVSHYYSVLLDGEICIPWNFQL